MPKFRTKSVAVEAVRFTGKNWDEVWALCPDAMTRHLNALLITTREGGTLRANVGDWVIREASGKVYPCEPETFEATYEPE